MNDVVSIAHAQLASVAGGQSEYAQHAAKASAYVNKWGWLDQVRTPPTERGMVEDFANECSRMAQVAPAVGRNGGLNGDLVGRISAMGAGPHDSFCMGR